MIYCSGVVKIFQGCSGYKGVLRGRGELQPASGIAGRFFKFHSNISSL